MAIAKKTIRLLILEDSQNEAERLVSLFRNAGHATRVHRLTSSEDLAETGIAGMKDFVARQLAALETAHG